MGLFGSMVGGVAQATGRAMGKADKKRKSQEAVEQWIRNQIEEEQEIEELYQKFVEDCTKTFQEIEQSVTIQDVLAEIVKAQHMDRDYSQIDRLPEEYRNSDEFKTEIMEVKNITYKQCVDAYLNFNKSVQYIMLMLRPLESVKEFTDEISHSLRHFDYFMKPGADVRSVLTDYDSIEDGIEDINENCVFDKELYGKLYMQHEVIRRLFQEEKYQEAFNNIACADFDETIYDYAKKMLIRLAIRASNSVKATTSYDVSRKLVDDLFRAMRTVYTPEGEHKYSYIRIPVVDMIIADAFKYGQSGMIDQVDDELKQFLKNFIINRDEMDAEQFEVLRKVFAYLKAYAQERTVLEFMVINNIPRNAEQENRLIFLKRANNGNYTDSLGDAPKEIFVEEEQGKLTYDYRSITWNESQIKSYLNAFSGENRTLKTRMVIDEWNKNLEMKGVRWNLNDIKASLEKCLLSNFGDRYILESVEAGAVSGDQVDYTESILIKESNEKYPWIQFIISAEQLTLNQISFSIYTLYNPNEDMQNESDCFRINSMIGNKLVSLKQKQNPKVNNYIAIVKNVVIAELENYLNENAEGESLY